MSHTLLDDHPLLQHGKVVWGPAKINAVYASKSNNSKSFLITNDYYVDDSNFKKGGIPIMNHYHGWEYLTLACPMASHQDLYVAFCPYII